MAIAPAVPETEVTIEADIVDLPEHEYQNADANTVAFDSNAYSVIKNLEVPPGAESAMRTVHKEPFASSISIHMELYLDNNHLGVLLREDRDKNDVRGYKNATAIYQEGEQVFTSSFRFSELEIGCS